MSSTISLLAGAQAEKYWTEERMRNATPMPVPEIQGNPSGLLSGAPAPAGPPVLVPPGAPGDTAQEPVGGQTERLLQGPVPLFGPNPFLYTRYRVFPDLIGTYKTFPYRTVGKLFFTIPGQGNFVCSAATVSSTNRSVVWTAGHCVATPGAGFHINFAFAPARRLASNPYGLWTPISGAGAVWTTEGWVLGGLSNYDHGALVMAKKVGIPIGNKIGSLGFAANVSRQQHWHLQGYPAAARILAQTPPGPQFDGVHQEVCAAAWATDDQPPPGGALDPPTIGVGCDQTGGTSGGPWVIDFSPVVSSFNNLLNGNNSSGTAGPIRPRI